MPNMESIQINSAIKESYNILVTDSLQPELQKYLTLKKYSKLGLIVDETVLQLWSSYIHSNIHSDFIISAASGEKHKNLESVKKIWSSLIDNQCDKTTLLILVGGGVIGDMGGFAAATFLRGIDFIHIPTTIISQVDSSIGGKTAINFSSGKNIIGLFHQPKLVLIDTSFLATLPDREYISGFAEIIKHGLIADKNYLNFVTSKRPREFSKSEMLQIVYDSCVLKSQIVGDDLLQKGQRKLVLFGHTIGQALEAASLESISPLTHGEAVSIGMVAETYLSTELSNVSHTELLDIERKLLFTGLPIRTNVLNSNIVDKLTLDKKIRNGEIDWTILEKVGRGTFDINITQNLVLKAIDYICQK